MSFIRTITTGASALALALLSHQAHSADGAAADGGKKDPDKEVKKDAAPKFPESRASLQGRRISLRSNLAFDEGCAPLGTKLDIRSVNDKSVIGTFRDVPSGYEPVWRSGKDTSAAALKACPEAPTTEQAQKNEAAEEAIRKLEAKLDTALKSLEEAKASGASGKTDKAEKKTEAATTDGAAKPGEAEKKESKAVYRINDYTAYSIPLDNLKAAGYRITGPEFGALVVPFKYYLGGDQRISASSTIAPYLGWRGLSPFGFNLVPIASAGLGLVPVNDAASGKTDTKSALSTAVGLLMTSDQNESFNAGILIGWDFLSRADAAADPTVEKTWLSLYFGLAIGK